MRKRLPFAPDATLDGVEEGWWMELCCACGRIAAIPRWVLVERHGSGAPVPGLVAGLRCPACGAPPVLAAWVDDPAGAMPGLGQADRRRVSIPLGQDP